MFVFLYEPSFLLDPHPIIAHGMLYFKVPLELFYWLVLIIIYNIFCLIYFSF